MRVAVLSDIHGNLPALEAVLQDVRHAGPDRVVIGGDVLPGPMPRECLDALLGLDIPVQFIHGNGDREALAHLSGREMTTVPEPFRGPVIWAAEQLGQKYRPILASWPLSLSENSVLELLPVNKALLLMLIRLLPPATVKANMSSAVWFKSAIPATRFVAELE